MHNFYQQPFNLPLFIYFHNRTGQYAKKPKVRLHIIELLLTLGCDSITKLLLIYGTRIVLSLDVEKFDYVLPFCYLSALGTS